MIWLIWLCGGWLASERGLCARCGAAASEKYSFWGRREYDCARLAPLAALMIPVGFWKNFLRCGHTAPRRKTGAFASRQKPVDAARRPCFSRPPKEHFTLTSAPFVAWGYMLLLSSIDRVSVAVLLERYGMSLVLTAPEEVIPGSYW